MRKTMNANRELWEKGDFTRIAASMRQSLGLTNLRFQVGDATDLKELDDEQFDLVVSIFGAMFAPKPFDVAKEMVRVTKSGGRIVMGNWIPKDPTLVAQILKISSSTTCSTSRTRAMKPP